MKSHDEIKKAMECCTADGGCRWDNGCPYGCHKECAVDLKADALALIQQLEAQVPRWISVEERLPERGITKCSACVKCGDGLKRVVCASYNAELKLWTGWHGEKIGNEITHWMPLPQPPKD